MLFAVLSVMLMLALLTVPFVVTANNSAEVNAAVSPEFKSGNPKCADLAPAGTVWKELKVEPPRSGSFSNSDLAVKVTVNGLYFDWSSNVAIEAVFVKGGPNGNLYVYNPKSTGDTGLHAPINPKNGKPYGLSHLSFCYGNGGSTPPPPPPPAQCYDYNGNPIDCPNP